MADHYAGDDTNVQTLAAGILAAYDGMSVDDFDAQSARSCGRRSTRRSVEAISNAGTRR